MRNPVSRFAYSKSDIGIKRSKFPRSFDHKTTMSAGLLYPLMVDEVLPGDTYSVDLSSLVRMSTPIHPVMDNCYLDIYFFFVPNRIVWDHWKEFMGESPSDPYISPIEYSVPSLVYPPDSFQDDFVVGVAPKSILDYMGVSSWCSPEKVSALPVRGFCAIWNEWFRDQNLQNAISYSTGDEDIPYAWLAYDGSAYGFVDREGTLPDAYVHFSQHGGTLPPVNKYHDYFTSALIEPQKGEPVPIPLSGFAPVYASDFFNIEPWSDNEHTQGKYRNALQFGDLGTPSLGVDAGMLGVNSSGFLQGTDIFSDDIIIGSSYTPINLGADLSMNKDTGIYATISDLRYAFQLQKFLEADNRGGTRYREILKQHFNVTSPDASQQIPEFLGGKRIPINISQVLQTSATDDVSPQGNTAAYSLTSDRMSAFTKSFTEHGYLFCVGCIRTEHTYGQGYEPMWARFNKFDFYFPEFANISEQPIRNFELFANLNYGEEISHGFLRQKQIFGYKEPWSEYKFKPNKYSGEFAPWSPISLDVWHYGDDYTSQPYLSSEWIRETRANIDRTLAVNDPNVDQFICDFYFKMDTVRAMPVYSIPGLADHH